jgi:hypothetical protein
VNSVYQHFGRAQLLAKAVMQVARDAPSFFVLRAQ